MTRTWHLLSWPYLEKTQIVKKYKTYKKYKSNDRVTWVRIVHVGKYWKYRDIDKNQFMFIRIYSLSELIIDSWPDKYLNYQPVFWPWPKMGLVGWYESLVPGMHVVGKGSWKKWEVGKSEVGKFLFKFERAKQNWRGVQLKADDPDESRRSCD